MSSDPRNWIIYDDDHLLAINKPAGVRVLPDGYHPHAEHIRSLLEPLFGKLLIVHRLDKDTSGVLLLARTPQAHRSLNLQFCQRTVEKSYHAIVIGCPSWSEIDITYPLKTNGDRRHRTVVNFELGKPASTHCKVLEEFQNYALLELHPKTGRTHQLRAHLAHINHPIAGDLLYTPAEIRKTQTAPAEIERPALHALTIRFSHPSSGLTLTLTAPHPPDFRTLIEKLREKDEHSLDRTHLQD